ncbi:MAG: hypothetical protein KAS72_06955 [Phycisphaerales bacterium]|nr:hypothetical protein [Phycisphaerales bacterium]
MRDSEIDIHPYDPERDKTATRRLWKEIGWVEDDKYEPMEIMVSAGRANVVLVDGEAECLVTTSPGSLRHLDRDLPMSCCTGVATSLIARKRGLAGRLTAHTIAEDVADGALLASLGIFDQGYYDRLGFANGPYVRRSRFDPAMLDVDVPKRSPVRLTTDDWEQMHAARIARRRGYGSLVVDPPAVTRADTMWSPKGFGLGFRDGENGKLTHHMWLGIPGDAESGPYAVWWFAYETHEQFLELLGVLKSLGDQVHGIRMADPPGIQMQSLIRTPFRTLRMTEKGKFEASSSSYAGWQVRICDVPACFEKMRLPGAELRFNVRVTDPIETFVPADCAWCGTAGSYVASLGRSSGAELAHDETLPTLTCSIGAMTRLWLGVGPATGLAVTDDLTAPRELLDALDETLRLPPPQHDWDF